MVKGNLRDIAKPSVIITIQENLAAEILARIAADELLQGNIDAEEQARIAADLVLEALIGDEESARIAADADLQEQIDILRAIARIRGSVNNFTDLPDPTTVSVGDGYIVHIDETHDDITSIYVSDGTDWIWVGEFAVDLTNYYTKDENDTQISKAVAIETEARIESDNALQEQIDNRSASTTVWVGDIPLYGATFIDTDENNRPVLREDGNGDWLIHLTMLNIPLARYVGKQVTDTITGIKYLFTVSGGNVLLQQV